MRELAVQSSNDTNSADDRQSLQNEVAQLQSELNRIANTTTFNNRTLLDGSFGVAKFHVGANANETINVTMGDARATNIGTNRLVNEFVSGTITEANAGLVNNVGATNFTVDGSLGSATITVAAATSARDLATAVNNNSQDTGVSADSITYAKIDGTGTGTNYAFDLFGQNETSAVRVSASLSTAGDLTELAKAINDVSGSTGVTAILSDDKTAILLENSEGYDITATSAAGTDTFVLKGVKEAGSHGTNEDFFHANSEVGSESVTAGNSATVGGNLVFDSSKSFSVTAAAAGWFADDTDAHSSSLEAVSDLSIDTQVNANLALSVIDSALSSISSLRAELGAVQNRMESTIANLSSVSENVSAARSRVLDADFAAETTNMTRAQILQQAGVAMLSQANAQPQTVLSLLQ
jgi:flagellin